MPMTLDHKLLSLFRTSSLGSLAGVGVSALLYKYFPFFFDGLTDRTFLVIYGGAIGAAVGRSIGVILFRLFRFGSYCERLLEIQITFMARIIDRQKCEQITNHLVDQRFGLLKRQQTRAEERGEVAEFSFACGEKLATEGTSAPAF